MIWMYLLLLFLLTLLGGAIPLLFKQFKSSWMTLLLAFSGSFLLGVTLLHLMPESFHELGEKAGLYILGGFFLQLILQRISHGVEHGHVHQHEDGHTPLGSVIIGLSIHAFMEGIPLGFNFHSGATIPSIFVGVATHKIPEAITLSALLLSSNARSNKWVYLILFALVSPVSGILAMHYGQSFYFIANLLVYIIPIVIGAFLHISTTILYESGTKHHELSRQKVIVILCGLGLSLATLLLPHQH